MSCSGKKVALARSSFSGTGGLSSLVSERATKVTSAFLMLRVFTSISSQLSDSSSSSVPKSVGVQIPLSSCSIYTSGLIIVRCNTSSRLSKNCQGEKFTRIASAIKRSGLVSVAGRLVLPKRIPKGDILVS